MPFLGICYRCNHRFYCINKDTLITELKQHFLKSHGFLPELPHKRVCIHYVRRHLGSSVKHTKSIYSTKTKTINPETKDYDIMVITWDEFNEQQRICNSGNKHLRAAFWRTANTKI